MCSSSKGSKGRHIAASNPVAPSLGLHNGVEIPLVDNSAIRKPGRIIHLNDNLGFSHPSGPPPERPTEPHRFHVVDNDADFESSVFSQSIMNSLNHQQLC